MKFLRSILILAAMLPCGRVSAETPQAAYGVTVVGTVSPGCTIGLRCSNLGADPYILLGGYASPGDGAGGYFALQPGSCTDNGGTVLKDSAGHCFYRMDDRAAVPVKWFGAKCDGVTTVFGGHVSAGSTAFVSTSVQFQSGDVGKVIELFQASGNPFRTKIDAVNVATDTVTLHTAAYNAYPGLPGASDAKFLPVLLDGLDMPGSGYQPGDTLTVTGGTYVLQATATVKGTGLVAFTIINGGSGFSVGDLITFVSTTMGVTQVSAPQIRVTNVSSGAVTGYAWVDYGEFQSGNPTGFSFLTSHGSGFAVSLLSSNGSFGVAHVKLAAAGAYSALPPIPAATSDSGTGTGATIDLSFPTPAWTYGTDDTVAFEAIEGYIESDFDRGIFNAAEVPGDHTCLLQTLAVNRPVTWRASGSRQGQLMQILGNAGSTVDGSRYGFVLAAANFPSFDTYQDTTVGQQAVGFNNITLAGGTSKTAVDVEGSQNLSYVNDGLLFQNPTGGAHTNVNAVLQNLQTVNFPGNALSANMFSGEFRGYNIYAGHSGGNCVDLYHTANPYRFYGLVASGCTIGINLNHTKSEEFHGVSVFKNSIDVSVTGTQRLAEAYILFDGAQFGHADNENMYLDQQNETVLCAANCVFTGAGENCTPITNPDCHAAVVIGPDATTSAGGLTPIIAQFNQGVFYASDNTTYDIQFDTAGGHSCSCRVALGGGMFDVNNGTPSTNNATLLTGQTSYAPPTFANAASVGVPLTLDPAELGIATSPSSSTGTAPGAAGLKLRVECSTAHPGTAKLVVLAGNSSTETVLADDIGSAVSCPP